MNLMEVKDQLEAQFNKTILDSVVTVEVPDKADLKGEITECYIRGFVPDRESYDNEQIMDLYLRPMISSFAQQCNRLHRDGHQVKFSPQTGEVDTDLIILDTEPSLKVTVEWRDDVQVDDDKMAGLVFSIDADLEDVEA